MTTGKFVFDLARRAVACGLIYSFAFLGFGSLNVRAQEKKLFDKFAKSDTVTNAVRDKSKTLHRLTLLLGRGRRRHQLRVQD